MTNAPERIWMLPRMKETPANQSSMDEIPTSRPALAKIEYIRADLANTDAQVMAHPKVRALVEALRDIAKQKRTDELTTEYDDECADFETGYDACINVARAALRDMEDGNG